MFYQKISFLIVVVTFKLSHGEIILQNGFLIAQVWKWFWRTLTPLLFELGEGGPLLGDFLERVSYVNFMWTLRLSFVTESNESPILHLCILKESGYLNIQTNAISITCIWSTYIEIFYFIFLCHPFSFYIFNTYLTPPPPFNTL
jgi:hypothetical protein